MSIFVEKITDMDQVFYYAIDADEIGKALEKLLLENKEKEVAAFSESVISSVNMVKEYFKEQHADIIFAGGDNILVKSSIMIDIVSPLPSVGNITWSVGIGSRIDKATLALKKAKGLGRNRIEML